MTDLTDEQLDHLRRTHQGSLDAAGKKGQVFAPVENIKDTVRALDELMEKRGMSPCRACGTRGATQGGYCGEHA